ncbi:hypothetical protein [uncultured Arsenicicoccus sp.]|mgnify:CR=1 FL=1|uniref:hypothetical protein n=1 Tax=uncultured Arsenicicoccus sp. TaxID=491339 RepID=UPI002599FCBB|nr:hypothetical protein [uncultured Arsenicicoccus sp.]
MSETVLAALSPTPWGAALRRKEREGGGKHLVQLLRAPDTHTRSFDVVPLACLTHAHSWRRSWTDA